MTVTIIFIPEDFGLKTDEQKWFIMRGIVDTKLDAYNAKGHREI